MTHRKLRLAFFASTFNTDSIRGASRLFRALIDTLSSRDDVELYQLLERLPAEFNPNNSIFKVKQYQVKGTVSTVFSSNDYFENPFNLKVCYKEAQKKYRSFIPKTIRNAIRPISSIVFKIFKPMFNFVRPSLARFQTKTQLKGAADFFSIAFLRKIFFPKKNSTTDNNKHIIDEYTSLDGFDVILNFWWFHTPSANELTGLCKNKVITYSWILDAIPLRIPHWQEGLISESVFRNQVQTHLEMSDRVVAISRSAAEDAHLFFSIPREKITTVPCGIYVSDFIEKNKEVTENFFKKYGIKEGVPIILSIGLQEPSKNTLNVIKACYNIARSGNKNFQLVIVGEHRGMDPQKRFGAVINKISESINVVFTGSITEEDKHILMSNADVFLYPSLWEGFGIPPLEAMAAGVPVVVSDIASLPEVCQDHVLYCDPYDPSDISEKVISILEMSEETRTVMLNKAREYAKEWLWDKKAVPELISDIRIQLKKFSDREENDSIN